MNNKIVPPRGKLSQIQDYKAVEKQDKQALINDNVRLSMMYDNSRKEVEQLQSDNNMIVGILSEIVRVYGNGNEMNIVVDPLATPAGSIEIDCTDVANGNIKLKLEKEVEETQ